MPITSDTLHELLDAVLEMNSAKDSRGFAVVVVAAMRRLIRADALVFQVLDRTSRVLETEMWPPEPFLAEEIAYYTANPAEFPLVAYYSQNPGRGAMRISDVVETEQWVCSEYYKHCLARQGLVYGLALPIEVDEEKIAALSFNRCSPDFSQRDRDLLDAFAPHFRLAWSRHRPPKKSVTTAQLQRLGLSPRESEVLYWMTEGKLNREISLILKISLGTVQEYVGNILLKLEQENRHAATVFAITKLAERPPQGNP